MKVMHPSVFALDVDALSSCLDIPKVMNCGLELRSEINSFSLKVVYITMCHHSIREKTKTVHKPMYGL